MWFDWYCRFGWLPAGNNRRITNSQKISSPGINSTCRKGHITGNCFFINETKSFSYNVYVMSLRWFGRFGQCGCRNTEPASDYLQKLTLDGCDIICLTSICLFNNFVRQPFSVTWLIRTEISSKFGCGPHVWTILCSISAIFFGFNSASSFFAKCSFHFKSVSSKIVRHRCKSAFGITDPSGKITDPSGSGL